MSAPKAFLGLLGPDSGRGLTSNARWSRMAARLTLAAAVGLAVGAVTEWSVLHLPFSFEPLSNTAAPWVLVAFAVALAARSMEESLVLAVVTLVALVLGFYAAQAVRGWSVSRHQIVLWSACSLVAGPLVGLAAGWFRHSGRTAGAVGAGILGGVLVGEAVHGLTSLRLSSPADYWYAQLILGVGLAIGMTLWRSQHCRLGRVAALAASVAACAVVGLGTLAAYQFS